MFLTFKGRPDPFNRRRDRRIEWGDAVETFFSFFLCRYDRTIDPVVLRTGIVLAFRQGLGSCPGETIQRWVAFDRTIHYSTSVLRVYTPSCLTPEFAIRIMANNRVISHVVFWRFFISLARKSQDSGIYLCNGNIYFPSPSFCQICFPCNITQLLYF